ncbi:MAG: sulfotransferase family 2 domain-containing protein [Gammaproteobacteria bacterium]
MELDTLLRINPQPIIASRNKLIVLWSAKAGCTFVVKWIFFHMGVFDAAFPRVHKYRVETLYPSQQYSAAVDDFLRAPGDYRAIKFVRPPFKRAVSSYIQAARFGYEDAGLSEFLGREIDATHRFSFNEFLRYLETVDLTNCNIHHQLQAHALERHRMLASMFLVNLDYSLQTLPKLESFLSLAKTDPNQFRESHHHTRKPSSESGDFHGDKVFDIYDKAAPEMPGYRGFYDAELTDRVASLYAEDLVRYGFSPSLDEERRNQA